MRINSVSINNTTIDGQGPYNLIAALFGNGYITQDPHKQKIDNLLRLWGLSEDEEEIIYQIPISLSIKLNELVHHLKTEYILNPDTESLVIKNLAKNQQKTLLSVLNLESIMIKEPELLLDNINTISHTPDVMGIKITNLKIAS